MNVRTDVRTDGAMCPEIAASYPSTDVQLKLFSTSSIVFYNPLSTIDGLRSFG
jgi:hypothetical protein